MKVQATFSDPLRSETKGLCARSAKPASALETFRRFVVVVDSCSFCLWRRRSLEWTHGSKIRRIGPKREEPTGQRRHEQSRTTFAEWEARLSSVRARQVELENGMDLCPHSTTTKSKNTIARNKVHLYIYLYRNGFLSVVCLCSPQRPNS